MATLIIRMSAEFRLRDEPEIGGYELRKKGYAAVGEIVGAHTGHFPA